MKKRVVAYCRVSTEKEEQQGSFENQKKYFEEFINSNSDWEFTGIYADEGISGTSVEKRESFKKMIEDAKKDCFDLILTKEIARFARNTSDSLTYTRKLKKLGVGVYFTTDNINTLDGDGELRLTIMAALAQEESRRTSQRVKWGQKRRMEQGVVFGRELLGYYLRDGELSINHEEAKIVSMIFHKYVQEAKGTGVIARELNTMNITTKRDNKWTSSVILKILRNEKYIGDLAQKKTITPDFLDHKKKYNKGEEELVYIKNHHEPIIDRETWDSAQIKLNRLLNTEVKRNKDKFSDKYWCSGKIICGICGSKYVARTKHLKNGQLYLAWRCSDANSCNGLKHIEKIEAPKCSAKSINHQVLNQIINFSLEVKFLNNKNDFNKGSFNNKHNVNEKFNTSISKRLEALNSKKHKLIDAMLEGILSKDDMLMMNERYNNEIENLKSKLLDNAPKEDIYEKCYCEDAEIEYRRLISKVVIHTGQILEVYFLNECNPLKIRYCKEGKTLSLQVNCEVIN